MTATATRTLRYTTVKQVERAVWRHRDLIGIRAHLHAETADGNHGRLYFLTVWKAGPVTAEYAAMGAVSPGYVEPFKNHPKAWFQGGIDRKTLLEWANETLPAPLY